MKIRAERRSRFVSPLTFMIMINNNSIEYREASGISNPTDFPKQCYFKKEDHIIIISIKGKKLQDVQYSV